MKLSSFIINRSKVFLDPNLELCLAQISDLSFLKARIQAMKNLRISKCFLFYPRLSTESNLSRPIAFFQEFLRKSGFEVHFIPPDIIKNKDYKQIKEVCDLVNITRREQYMFFCFSKNIDFLRQFICMFAYLQTGQSRTAIYRHGIDYLNRELDLDGQDHVLVGFFDYVDETTYRKTNFWKKIFKKQNFKVREQDTKEVRIGIRTKLISIISLIIFISLGGLTYFTYYFFSDDALARIQENHLHLVRLYGKQIETEFKRIRLTTQLVLKNLTKVDYFTDNPSWFYIATVRRDGNFFRTVKEGYNEKLFSENKLKKKDFTLNLRENVKYFEQSERGLFAAFNASLNKVPILGLTYKLGEKIVVVYLQPTILFNNLQNVGATSVFVVNRDGYILMTKDAKQVIEKRSFQETPIFITMLESSVSSGQSFYDYNGKNYIGSYKSIGVGRLAIFTIIETDIILSPVVRLQRINLLIGAVILCIALLVTFYFAKTIIVPVRNLVAGIFQIDQGNFDIPIRPMYKDEIGSLTVSFKEMAEGLGERERIKIAFSKFVNIEVVDRVLSGDLKLGGDRKTAAIFFSDLRGFTAMSEGMEPEEIVKFLNDYFTRMVHCVSATYGVVDKYIGDAIMAHWGAIRIKGNSTENAVNAALMMRKELIQFNQDNMGKFPFAKMGSGINTGPVISGQIGSEERLEYTIIGDAVNLASRIEALNKPFYSDILISSDSYKLVKNIFKVETMPSITVKGKSEPQKIYAVIGRFDDPECLETLDQVREQIGVDFRGPVGKDAVSSKEEKFKIVG